MLDTRTLLEKRKQAMQHQALLQVSKIFIVWMNCSFPFNIDSDLILKYLRKMRMVLKMKPWIVTTVISLCVLLLFPLPECLQIPENLGHSFSTHA